MIASPNWIPNSFSTSSLLSAPMSRNIFFLPLFSAYYLLSLRSILQNESTEAIHISNQLIFTEIASQVAARSQLAKTGIFAFLFKHPIMQKFFN